MLANSHYDCSIMYITARNLLASIAVFYRTYHIPTLELQLDHQSDSLFSNAWICAIS